MRPLCVVNSERQKGSRVHGDFIVNLFLRETVNKTVPYRIQVFRVPGNENQISMRRGCSEDLDVTVITPHRRDACAP